MNRSVLVVDDDQEVRNLLSLFLKMLGFSDVVQATNGEEALELFQRGEFCLVTCDITMPRMNGQELIRVIKETCPSQPILLVTAREEEAKQLAGLVDGVLIKPQVEIEDVRRELEKMEVISK